MKNMAEKGDKRAELVLKLLENFDKLLSTILVGNNIVNIGLSSLATVLFIKLLGGDSGATVSTIGNHYRGPDPSAKFPRKALQKNLRRRSPNFPHRFSTF